MKRKSLVGTLRVEYDCLDCVHPNRTKHYADVVELVDTLALGASASGREGSSPFIRTNVKTSEIPMFLRL